MTTLRFKEVDNLVTFLFNTGSYFIATYERTNEKIEGKEVSKIKFITPGNDEVIISFFEDRSTFLEIEINSESLTFIDRKFIPIKRKTKYNCKEKIIDFELDMRSEGYKKGYIKIYNSESDSYPEAIIEFDYFFYYEV